METPPAEELLKKIRELEESQEHLKREMSRLKVSAAEVKQQQQQRSHSMSPQRRRNSGGEGAGAPRWRKSGTASFRHASPLRKESRGGGGEEEEGRSGGGGKFTEKQYLNILQSMAQAVHVFDLNGQIIFWNAMAEKLYGFSAAEALGKDPIDILVDNQDAAVAQNITRRCGCGESWTGEFPVKNKAGDRFSVVTTMSPFYDDDGSLIGIICITNDAALFQDPRVSQAKTRGQEGETSFSRVASKLGLDSKEAVVSKLGLDSQQPIQVAIKSKISDLASKVGNKVRSKIQAGDNSTAHLEGGSGDSHHSVESSPALSQIHQPVVTMSHLVDPTWRLLAASGGDTVKLFDVSSDSGDPCVLSYTPTPGSAVSSVKWNHTNLVVASAGDDKKISLWWINGSSLGTVPVAGKDGGDSAEECLSAISFGRKGSKFIASGGTGQIVKIWDLQKKLCVKKLRGHTSTITGVMYNCKDEHLASVSVGGDLIVHNLKTGARASELKDPHGQVLRVLDYSRSSRHLLLTAGDDGTVHLWDTTGRNPKMSWKQHSAPAAGVCFSPSDEKKIASVGMDKKLYTYDSGSKRFSSCISYEAPFSSLAFGDNGHILAAGTGNGRVVFYDVRKTPQPVTVLHAFSSSEAVTSLTWQTSKPVIVNEKNYDGEMALLGGTVDDSVIIPDPVPSTTPSDSQPAGSRGTATSTSNVPSAEQTPNRTLWPGAPPGRLHALRAIDSFNDDMRVFSPIVDVSSAEKWADSEGFNNKDHLIDNKKPFASSSKGFPYGDGNKEHTKAAFSPFGTTTPTASTKSEDSSSSALTPPESWGGDRLSDKFNQLANEKISDKFPSRLGVSSTSGGSTSGSMFPLSSLGQTNLAANVSSEFPRIRDFSSASETDKNLPSSPLFAKGISAPGNIDSLRLSPSLPRRTYAERISSSLSTGSPKIKKTGAETREETFSNLMPRPELGTASEALPIMNGGNMKQSQNDVGGSNFTLQLFQRTLEGTLDSFQNSVHDDMRNLHIEILRQFHMHEMEMSKVLSSVLENQAEIMKELQLLRKENQQLRQRL